MTKRSLLATAIAVGLSAVPIGNTAQASLVLSAVQDQTAYGFGTVLTLMSLQSHGNNTTEQGCNPFGSGYGAFTTADNNFAGTVPNVGNFCNEALSDNTGSNPQNDVPSGTPKTALPVLSEASILSPSQIGVLVNLNQSGQEGITLNGLVLSFYTATGDVVFTASLAPNFCSTLIGTLCSGANTFAFSEPGQGSAGFLFVLDAAQQALLTTAMAANSLTFGNTFVGVSASAGCATAETANCQAATGGAESFTLIQVATPTTVPEPSTAALLVTGLVGLAGYARRRVRGK